MASLKRAVRAGASSQLLQRLAQEQALSLAVPVSCCPEPIVEHGWSRTGAANSSPTTSTMYSACLCVFISGVACVGC